MNNSDNNIRQCADELHKRIFDRKKVFDLAKKLVDHRLTLDDFKLVNTPIDCDKPNVTYDCPPLQGVYGCTDSTDYGCGTDLVYQCGKFECTGDEFTCNVVDFMCNYDHSCTGSDFQCDGRHIYQCEFDFECKTNFGCTTTNPLECPAPGGSAIYGCEDGYSFPDANPGDFHCGTPGGSNNSFDCLNDFNCDAADEFTCIAGTDFECTVCFDCGENSEFDCMGVFDCLNSFGCLNDFDCLAFFSCGANDVPFDCEDPGFYCKEGAFNCTVYDNC